MKPLLSNNYANYVHTLRYKVVYFYLRHCVNSTVVYWPICWCCLDRGPGSFDVEDATTLSWSSAAVSE